MWRRDKMVTNISEVFSSFGDIGTAIGDFFFNLISGLFPTIILLAVIGVVIGALVAVGAWIVSSLKHGMSRK